MSSVKIAMTSIFVYERDNFKFVTDNQLRNQSFKVAGAGRSDANHGVALAEKRLAENRQYRWSAIPHPGSHR